MPSIVCRTRLVLMAMLALVWIVGYTTAGSAQAPAPADLAIVHVNIVDVAQGQVLPDQTVLISGGTIEQVAPAGQKGMPAADQAIDGTGKYLIPGLWDMHAHVRANGLPAWISTEWLMPLLVAHGVTGARDMASDCENPEQGPVCMAQMREWQAQVEAGKLLGPRLMALSSFPVNPPWDYPVSEEEVRAVMQHFKENGLEHVKIYDRLSPEAFAMVMDEVVRHELDAWGHVPLRVSAANASSAGLRSLEHARDFLYDCFPGSAEFRRTIQQSGPTTDVMRAMVADHDPAMCEELFRTLVRNDTWYVPTHVTRRMEAFAGDSAFRNDPRARYIPPPLMEQWVADADRTVARDSSAQGRRTYMDFYLKGLEITGAAHRAGVRVLLGTDGGDSFVFPGSSVHDELGELVSAGLSPAAALRAATWNGAEFLGLTSLYGSAEVGKRADLVLLSGNPLEDIGNTRRIHAVIFGGQFLDRGRLDGLLQQAESAAKRSLDPGAES